MTESTPLSPVAVLEDPALTRLLRRRVGSEDAAVLARVTADTVTSACVLLPVLAEPDGEGLEVILGWEPSDVRVEFVSVAPSGHPARSTVRSTLMGSGRSWRMIDHPRGGRVGALAAAAAAAEYEFLVIPGPGRPRPDLLDRVPATLMAMWREGADAAVLGAVEPRSGDPADYLVAGFGLAGGASGSQVVVLRRWVGRWIFNEATRAIVPAEEVADRVRLLGVAILAVADGDDRDGGDVGGGGAFA